MEVDTPRPTSPPDPPDHTGTAVPEHIVFLLHAVRTLLGYGNHLLTTIRHRATAPTFPIIAACFGTANLSTICAHLNRGILRAAALERYLLARAATGRDIDFVTRRTREQPVTRKATPRPSLPPRLGRASP